MAELAGPSRLSPAQLDPAGRVGLGPAPHWAARALENTQRLRGLATSLNQA